MFLASLLKRHMHIITPSVHLITICNGCIFVFYSDEYYAWCDDVTTWDWNNSSWMIPDVAQISLESTHFSSFGTEHKFCIKMNQTLQLFFNTNTNNLVLTNYQGKSIKVSILSYNCKMHLIHVYTVAISIKSSITFSCFVLKLG